MFKDTHDGQTYFDPEAEKKARETNQEEREKRFERLLAAIINEEEVEECHNKIKSFIQSEIDLVLANRNKEIVTELQKIVDEPNVAYSWHSGELQAFINLITKNNE